MPVALTAAIYAPTLTTGFLGDDYTFLVSLDWWAESGEVPTRVLHNFVAGIDAASQNSYRPLPVASFALNFAVGTDPVGWRAVNLALHLACGALLVALTTGLAARPHTRSIFGAVIAGAIFLLSPASPEVGAWVAGRFDSIALLFMLLALLLFARSVRWNDCYGLAGLGAAVLAFMSKESATLLPLLVLALAVAQPGAAASGRGTPSRLIVATRRAAPCFALLAVYLLWRIAIFGSPVRIFADSEPVAALVGGRWLTILGSSGDWLVAEMPEPSARRMFGICLAITLGLGAVWCLTHRGYRLRWLALVAAVAAAVLLPLLQVQQLDSQGEGGRLFYVAVAALAMLIALPYALSDSDAPWMWNRALRILFLAATGITILSEAILLSAALRTWQIAGAQAKQLAAAIARLPAQIPADAYAFVLIPDRIGGVPFGRLAQGGLTLPPVQPKPLLSHLVVQTENDLADWPANIRRGIVDALKRYPAREVLSAMAAGAAAPGGIPTTFFCWDITHAQLAPLMLPGPLDGEHWLPAWRKALAASPCHALAQAVPDR